MRSMKSGGPDVLDPGFQQVCEGAIVAFPDRSGILESTRSLLNLNGSLRSLQD